MNIVTQSFLNIALLIAVIIGWARIQWMNSRFIPFIVLINCGLLCEIISLLLITNGSTNRIVYNIYSLAEVLLILWLFYRWQLWNKQQLQPLLWGVVAIIIWAGEWCCRGSINRFFSWSILFYSFIILIYTVQVMSMQIVMVKKKVWKNARLIICIAFLLYFTITIALELFWMYGNNLVDDRFKKSVTAIHSGINFITNLLYAFAILWIPLKPRHIC